MGRSLPAWERGLKRHHTVKDAQYRPSLPAWERGLKQLERRRAIRHPHVAPRVGAWIETRETTASTLRTARRSPRGSVD